MNLERTLIRENLPRKGFHETDSRSHIFYHLYHNGKKTHIRTQVSRGSKYKVLSSNLVSAMARQCKLTSRSFCDLVECHLSGDDYIAILRDQGEL